MLPLTEAVPSEVTGVSLSVVPGQAAILVSWNKPNSSQTIIEYEVEYGERNVVWLANVAVPGANSLTTTITNLQWGTIYVVRVRAVSGAGAGIYTEPERRPTVILPSLPPQVTGVSLSSVTPGQSAIRVTWAKATIDGTFSRYDVQYKASDRSWDTPRTKTVVDQNVVTIDLTNIQQGTTYNVRVRAVSNLGNGPYSAEATFTVPRVPSEVTGVILTVVSRQTAIRVDWDKPSSDLPIIRYEVEYGNFSVEWLDIVTVQGADSLTTVITNLDGGTEYVVRIRAVSNAGNGDYNSPPRPTLILLSCEFYNVPPQVAGVNLSVVSGQSAIRVNWNKSSVDGNFSRYDVQYKTSSQSWDAATTETVEDQNIVTIDLTNLQRGTTYNVRVRAVSNVGNGSYSDTEDTETIPASVPSEVTGVSLSVVSGQATIRVNWNKSSVEGNFSRYDVQYKISYQSWGAATTETVEDQNVVTIDLQALQRGTTYNVRVRAVSNAGNGPYSTEATSTLPRLPSQVDGVSLSVVSGQATIRVTWTKPSVEGTFSRYDVQYKKSFKSWDVSSTQRVVDQNAVTVYLTNLQRSTTYNVRVRAVSNAGNAPYSAEATSTLPGLPSEVTGVMMSVVSGQAAIRVYWDKPNSNQPIIRYEVEYGERSVRWIANVTVPGADSLTTTITNLQRVTTYVVRVRAVSGAGVGNYTSPPDRPYLILPSLPPQVTVVSLFVLSGRSAIRVTWANATIAGTFIRYHVQYKTHSQSWDVSTTETIEDQNVVTVDLTNILRGTTYNVRVRAVSNAGNGPYSAEPTAYAPYIPTGVAATSIDTSSVTITWSSVGFNYRISAQREGSSERSSQDPVSPPHTITGLDSNTGYTITVEAYSPLGQAGKNINVNTLPEDPSNLNLEVVSSTVIRVTWTAPPNADRLPLTYLISYQSEFGSGMKEASTQPVELTGLHPFAEYIVRVQARNIEGQLSVSVTGKITTLSAAPSSPPQKVLIVDALKTHDSLTCAWQLPVRADRNGIITSYFIIVTRVFDEEFEQQPLGNFTKAVDSPSFDAPTHLRYTFINLTAITFYSIRIAAVTSGGTGIFSDLLTRKTNYELYVSLLTIQVDSDTSATISWAAPEGVDSVTSYIVYYGVYLIGSYKWLKTSIRSQLLSRLTPETPIEVSVIPNTSPVPGGSVSRIFFTREGVPTVPVKDVTVIWINSVLRVSWTPLSLHEARGWPLYTVIVNSTAGMTTRLATITSNTHDSTVDVDGLDPSTSYSVRVQVGTSAGTSAASTSDPVELQTPSATPTSPMDSNVGVIVGIFVAGLVAGALGLLVVGIVFGACKLIKQQQQNGSKESGSDPNAFEMAQSPVYESVDKAYENVEHLTQLGGVPKKINEECAIIE